MCKTFDACKAKGGKIRTIKIGSNRYMRLCVPSSGGKAQYTRIKTKKKR